MAVRKPPNWERMWRWGIQVPPRDIVDIKGSLGAYLKRLTQWCADHDIKIEPVADSYLSSIQCTGIVYSIFYGICHCRGYGYTLVEALKDMYAQAATSCTYSKNEELRPSRLLPKNDYRSTFRRLTKGNNHAIERR